MTVSNLDKQLALALKNLRKNRSITQKAIADGLNLDSQQQYSDLENGKKHFSDEVIIRICSFFQVSIVDLTNTLYSFTSDLNYLSDEINGKILAEENSKDIKLVVYKKLLLEAKIENIEIKLKMLIRQETKIYSNPSKHKIYVLM